jgi:iron complex outermembrane receptor protein
VEGRFDVGTRQWFWDVNGSYGLNEAEQENRGSYNIRNIVTALGDPAVCAATPGCTPLDIFGFNTITRRCSPTSAAVPRPEREQRPR